ncbi:LPXTG cell wall anchor domain-containing protein [Streptomyces rubellomurinus]|uniref:LPXTG cell wall anchor domain-containing protein n=1 Tax=Streptomyces rubellomurinus (strain ATCC 31215) TaxID=359131 RepID=UPI0006963A33|nr:LPXTG cell wall anchor domain-containing protein [Streptomyces rubellomurinus]
MGEPHDGASNGGVGPALVLRSTVKGAPDSPTDTHRIVVGSIANSVVGVPGTAAAGGAPIEFEVHLTNPTPSAYTNLGNVLFADRRARVEARAADGNWVSLEPVVTIPDDPAGFSVNGPDSSAEPGSDQVAKVRVSYPADMPLGGTALNPCVFVNEGEGHPFQGTTMCSAGAEVQVVAPAAPAPSTAPDRTGAPAAAGARPAADVTPQAAAITDDKPVIAADGGVTPWAANPAKPAEGELAATGTDLHWAGSAGVAALLLGAGGAGLILVRRRRATR